MDAAGWDERYAGADLVWSVEPNEFVAQHVAGRTPGFAIDLAAGEGRNAIWLAGRGWDVAAVDFSSVALAKGRQLAEARDATVTWVEADVTSWSPTLPADLVLLSYLQLPDGLREDVVRRAAGWVGPGGAVLVVGHDKANVAHGHGGPPSTEVCYDLDATVAALDELEVTHAAVEERHVATDDGDRVALDTVVLATRPDD